jgi:hypothetical protein
MRNPSVDSHQKAAATGLENARASFQDARLSRAGALAHGPTTIHIAPFVAVIALLSTALPASAQAPWDSIGHLLQSPPAAAAGYTRYNFPRKDITLKVGDVTVATGLALGTWAGFSGPAGNATVMGDIVVTANELKPVLAELATQGLTVTAVHNHLAGESPTITYVHFHGRGPALDLAARFDHVIARTGAPRPVTPAAPAPVTIDTAQVFSVLGARGRAGGAVAQLGLVVVPGAVLLEGDTLVPAMAYGTPINIQAVTPDRYVATGDFAVLGSREASLTKTLAAHGIIATAVHTHLIGETPKLSYIHFWADGRPADVLAGLRAALDSARGP